MTGAREDAHAEAPTPEPVAFASFTARFHALVVDLAIAALVLLYEPLLVARRGGTVGHRRANLRVVHERTGGPPGFARAFARFALKSAVGLPSFTFMALTRRHQALHDRLTDTTVRIRDLGRARDTDVAWERAAEELEPVGVRSRVRRAGVTVAYLALALAVAGVLAPALVSEACGLAGRCTPRESLTSSVLALGWVAASAWVVVAGWRGRLWGCRGPADAPELDAGGA